jgi:hypothetical protein
VGVFERRWRLQKLRANEEEKGEERREEKRMVREFVRKTPQRLKRKED